MRKLNVLMVDDNLEVLNSMVRFFKISKLFKIKHTTDPQEALRWITDGGKFDAVVSDMQMPVLNGMKLYQAVQKHSPKLADKFIFMSGGAGDAESAKFLREARHRLDKPARMSELAELIQKVANE